MIPGCAGLLARSGFGAAASPRATRRPARGMPGCGGFQDVSPTTEFKPHLPGVRLSQDDGRLAEVSEINVTRAMTIVCIAVSVETRTSVAELVPTVAESAPTVADATERCCAGRIAGLLAEGGGGRSDALIHGTGPFAAGLHSADGHDGRDDGVDFLGRSLLIRLFIAGRILADADV